MPPGNTIIAIHGLSGELTKATVPSAAAIEGPLRSATGSARRSPRGITAVIPSKTNRKTPIPHDPAPYRQRHHIENMFGKFKDWRRIHTR